MAEWEEPEKIDNGMGDRKAKVKRQQAEIEARPYVRAGEAGRNTARGRRESRGFWAALQRRLGANCWS